MSAAPKFKYEEQAGCLVIRIHGRDILEQKAATFQALAAAIKTRSPRATLVDLRAVPGHITFMDRYQLGEQTGRYLSGLTVAARLTVAALMKEEQADQERIGQKVAMNRGARVEVFTDPAAAEAWLKKHAAPA